MSSKLSLQRHTCTANEDFQLEYIRSNTRRIGMENPGEYLSISYWGGGGGCKHSSGVFHNANAALIRTRPDLLCGDGRHAHKRALPL